MDKEIEDEFKEVYTKILSLEKRQKKILKIIRAIGKFNNES